MAPRTNRRHRVSAAARSIPAAGSRSQSADAKTAPLANVIASGIAEQIATEGIDPGVRLGNEAQLMRRLSVSRVSLREAIRILEWQGLVAPERGGTGGLCVANDPVYALAGMLRTHLQLSDVSVEDVMDAGDVISGLVMSTVAATLSPAQTALLRRAHDLASRRLKQGDHAAEMHKNLLRDIAALLAEPALKAFANVLFDLGADFGRSPGRGWCWNKAKPMMNRIKQLIEALGEHDADAAIAILRTMTAETTAYLTRQEQVDPSQWTTASFLGGDYCTAIEHVQGSNKSAVQLAFAIAAKIRRNSLAPGTRLGTQASMLPNEKVGLKVLREAARLLEFFGIVEMRVGKQGGMFVVAPDPTTVIQWASRYLRWAGAGAKSSAELQTHLATRSSALAASRASSRDILRLTALGEQLASGPPEERGAAVSQLQRELIHLSGNRVMTLMETVLLDFTRGDSRPAPISDADRIGAVLKEVTHAYLHGDRAHLGHRLLSLRACLAMSSASQPGAKCPGAITGRSKPRKASRRRILQ